MRCERNKEWRRFQTQGWVERRVKQFMAVHNGGPVPKRVSTPGHLRDTSGFCCNCRKRAKGNPHCGGGICHFMVRSPVVQIRRDGKRQCAEWQRATDLWDADPGVRAHKKRTF